MQSLYEPINENWMNDNEDIELMKLSYDLKLIEDATEIFRKFAQSTKPVKPKESKLPFFEYVLDRMTKQNEDFKYIHSETFPVYKNLQDIEDIERYVKHVKKYKNNILNQDLIGF